VTEADGRATLGDVDLFITSMVIYAGLLAVLAAPLFYVTWRKNRLTAARNFVISALVIALLCAVLAVVSERQVLQCIDAGNSDCFDSGAVGLQLLFIGIYVVIAWSNAFWMWRD
jgi:Tfp pilus assembly protein FimT